MIFLGPHFFNVKLTCAMQLAVITPICLFLFVCLACIKFELLLDQLT